MDIVGGEGDDSLEGLWSESNSIRGLGGDDTLSALGWNDTLDGGAGDDQLRSGGYYGDLLIGGDGADTLIGYAENESNADLLRGGDGDDLLIGGWSDTLDAGDGDDTVRASESSIYVSGGDGDDVIEIDYVSGGVVIGGEGFDRLIGSGELAGCDLSGVEVLEVVGGVSATAEQLEGLERIESHERNGDELITLRLGVQSVDISGKLGTLGVHIYGAGSVVTGGGDDWIEMARKADGGAGDDTIEGGSGEDRVAFRGGAGDDSLRTEAEIASLAGGAGDDALSAWGGDRHALSGGDGADAISSKFARALAIDGGAGDDVVDVRVGVTGGGELRGGEGADRLVAVGDISELTVDGFETLATRGFVRATNAQFEAFETISGRVPGSLAKVAMAEAGAFDLSAQLKGGGAFIIGSAGDDTIFGAGGDDVVRGAEGDDLADGGAGDDRLIASAGFDTLSGGEGDDFFEVGRRSRAELDGGAGTDTLVGSYDLSALSVSGVEVLDTRGGYVLATAELLESFETIVASQSELPVNLTLAKAGDLDLSAQLAGEDARVLGSRGADAVRTSDGADTIDGAEGDDTLDGSGGDDTLTGGEGDDALVGGAGSDRLEGGYGDDLYVIDADDKIIEAEFGGSDTVRASFSYALKENFEHLELAGSDDLSGTGRSGANRITGNDGDNILDGRDGSDTLEGGAGRDTFLFTTATSGRNVDDIADFRSGEDVLWLDQSVFAGIVKGAVKASAFKDISTGDPDRGDRILYDADTGELFFDADGVGVAKARLFAVLDGAPPLSASDFLII